MELLKLYRGNDNHHLALHRDDAGLFHYTATPVGWDREPAHVNVEAWIILDRFEQMILDAPHLEIKPVPLLVATFNGRKRYFETPDEVQAYYSDPAYGLGDEPARVADLLSRRLPVIFGRLTVYREKPWHFVDGLTYPRTSCL